MEFLKIFASGIGIGALVLIIYAISRFIVKKIDKIATKSIEDEKTSTLVLCRVSEIAMVLATVAICIGAVMFLIIPLSKTIW